MYIHEYPAWKSLYFAMSLSSTAFLTANWVITSKNCLRENIVRERELYWTFHTLLGSGTTTQFIGAVCSFPVEQIANNQRTSSAASGSVDRPAFLRASAP